MYKKHFSLTDNGTPTKLKEGDVVVWRPAHHLMSVHRPDRIYHRMTWGHGDDKRIVEFLLDHPLCFDLFIKTAVGLFGFDVEKIEGHPDYVMYKLVEQKV